jgi:hypothetical protein
MKHKRQFWPIVMASLIQRKRGASLDELCRVLSWQAKSVRAGITKLRATGMRIDSIKDPRRGRVYRFVRKARGGA